jgi:hypothetical protein
MKSSDTRHQDGMNLGMYSDAIKRLTTEIGLNFGSEAFEINQTFGRKHLFFFDPGHGNTRERISLGAFAVACIQFPHPFRLVGLYWST